MSYTTKKIYGAIKRATETKTSAYDTTATVKRIEGSTAWVHIPGGIDETPVNLTIAAKEGDNVQIRVGGGRAWIVGNGTSPPTDNTAAFHADFKATEAQNMAINAQYSANSANKLARQVSKIAGNTNQYFWHTETGGDTGAHITEIPKDDFLADPDNGGGNLLARSNGIAVREGLLELATFAVNGIELKGRYAETYMKVADGVNSSGKILTATYFIGDGITKVFTITDTVDSGFSVTVYPLSGSAYNPTYTVSSNTYTFSSAPALGAIIAFTYNISADSAILDDSINSKYALGYREPYITNHVVHDGRMSFGQGYRFSAGGFASHCEGEECITTGRASHAEGYKAISGGHGGHAENRGESIGDLSHAEGFLTKSVGQYSHSGGSRTIAQGQAQTAIGKSNIAQGTPDSIANSDHAFIVGNGTMSTPSNALQLTWNGFMTIAGTLTQASDKRLKDHREYLNEDAVEFIRALKPAYFYKDECPHLGFYAQEVEEVDKWNCMIGEMNGFKTLGYTEIIAPLVAYCQKLEQRIEDLERRL